MNQELFSKSVYEFLEKNFPGFISTVKYQNDCSFDCNLKSESKIFSIWIATYNSEITIGLEDPDGNSNIHTHISCYEDEDLPDCLQYLKEFINNIKNDKLILYRRQNGIFDWINSTDFKDKIGLEKYSWS